MTEAEWQASEDAGTMLAFLRSTGRLSDRKLRLFNAACCRSVWPFLEHQVSREAVELAERYADKLALEEERQAGLQVARSAAFQIADDEDAPLADIRCDWGASVAWMVLGFDLHGSEELDYVNAEVFLSTLSNVVWEPEARTIQATAQTAIARDIFSNPFRRTSVDDAWLAWNDGALVKAATAAYEQRSLPSGHLDTARLGVLADMLEEAGCTDAQILEHLRDREAVHVRGCWAVDFLLGKG